MEVDSVAAGLVVVDSAEKDSAEAGSVGLAAEKAAGDWVVAGSAAEAAAEAGSVAAAMATAAA